MGERFELLRPECAVSHEPPFRFPQRPRGQRASVDAAVDRARYKARLLEYDFIGTEPELSPAGRPDERIHTGVHERRVAGQQVPVALYPLLDAGTWTLWGCGPCATRQVEIVDGQVAHVDWR